MNPSERKAQQSRLLKENLRRIREQYESRGMQITTSQAMLLYQQELKRRNAEEPLPEPPQPQAEQEPAQTTAQQPEAAPEPQPEPVQQAEPQPEPQARQEPQEQAQEPEPEPEPQETPPQADNAEVERLRKELDELRARLNERESIVAARQAKIEELEKLAEEHRRNAEELRRQAEDNKPITKETLAQYYSQEEIDLIGEEACAANLRATLRAVRSATLAAEEEARKRYQKELEALRAERSALFLDRARARVQDLNRIDTMPEFMAWLDQKDPISGRTRRELGLEAAQKNDLDRFVAIYDTFRREVLDKNKKSGNATPRPAARYAPDSAPPQIDTSAVPAASRKPTIAEIKEFEARLRSPNPRVRPSPDEIKRFRARVGLSA
ncbi:MAG: hypothetical protein IRZ03_13640 [Acidobacterium ailaaui]|nr:hypothetical protein [Pseudacidobacterium ailaaui]